MKTLLHLAWASLGNRRLVTSLTILSIGLSVALLVGVEQVRAGARESFSGTISQTDLIAGPRAGTVSLLLYTVFRLGTPLNNIRYDTYQRFRDHPAVRWAIPLEFGDSHRGYRVVATDASFYLHYRYRRDRSVTFRDGSAPQTKADVALGAEVADRLGYHLGSKLVLTHGIAGGLIDHDTAPFTVCGILERTSTPIDRSLYITFAGIAAMHEEDEPGPPQVSAFLLKMKSRIDTLRVQREIATYRDEPLSAVIPGVALAELWSTVRYAEDALRLVSACVLVVGLMGMLVALYTTLNERRREMAVLRAVGVTAGQITALLVFEALLLSIAGCVVGVGLVYGLTAIARGPVEQQWGIAMPITALTPLSLVYLAAIPVAAMLIGLIPAWRAYRQALNDGLSVKL